MILFSPAKVNIGLHITEKRPDGFHNLQSVVVPIGLCDILEFRLTDSNDPGLQFSQSGIPVDGGAGNNLCEKAHEMINTICPLPPVEIHLHKQIPVGAGLGGGSSNATTSLEGLNTLASGTLSREQLHAMAASLGSDCPFFLHRKPMMMEGRGELLSPVSVSLSSMFMVVLFPEIHISTKEAYASIHPRAPERHLRELISSPVEKWRDLIVNDFEKGIFRQYPQLEQMKQALYQSGALYASLSGSGSSLFGIYRDQPRLPASLAPYVIWKGEAGKVPVTK